MFELEFEKPLTALERQIKELEAQKTAAHSAVDLTDEIDKLRQSYEAMRQKIYSSLTPVDIVKVSRHPDRPQGMDYVNMLVQDFTELHGDRHYGDDRAIICGFGRIGPGTGRKVMIVVHNKGKGTEEKIKANFGCAHPEGYRKALRCMKLAEKFGVPIVTLVDTPGAYPGIGAEERGQAEAIAMNLREMADLTVPVVSVVIGEGGSGGALGIAVADRLAMMRYSWYSVISPEGCASILWKEATPANNAEAATALKLTAEDNLKNGTVDVIVEEPLGAAHQDPEAAASLLEAFVLKELDALSALDGLALQENRYQRLRNIGAFQG